VTGEAARTVADLVRRARDPRAPIRTRHASFATLVERFEDMAFATALPWSDGPESARDACQEAFLVAWRRLPALREPAAFGSWLKRLLRTQCSRARRRRGAAAEIPESAADTAEARARTHDTAELVGRRELQRLLQLAVAALPPGEREAVVLFYFLGEPLRAIARTLGVSVGVAGKRVYTARLRLRRALPRSITETFLATTPTPAFARRVGAGVLDEFVGEYRFPSRPGHRVIVRREGDVLASYAGGQRNVLASRTADTLTATEFDGEARFQRDRRGHIRSFIYYEFGRRLGVARKVVGAGHERARRAPQAVSPASVLQPDAGRTARTYHHALMRHFATRARSSRRPPRPSRMPVNRRPARTGPARDNA
jgi:RNA polymerase sigma-70 factor (ECF subfamily)